MKGFRSALRLNGAELPEAAERAHILASIYSDLWRDFIAKSRNWRMNGFIIAGAGAAVAIFALVVRIPLLLVLGLLVAAGGATVVTVAIRRMPQNRVRSICKGYWVGSFQDFEGGQLLVDKSRLTRLTGFSVPVPGMTPEEMVSAAATSRKAVESLPILAPRTGSGDGPEGSGRGDPFRDIKAPISAVARGLENFREEQVALPVLPCNSPLTQAIVRDIGSAGEVTPGQTLGGVSSQEIRDKLAGLGRLTGIVREKAGRTASVDELAEQVVSSMEADVKTLDNTQRTSLVEVLNKQLLQLEHAYQAPMRLYYCPECLKEAARLANIRYDRILGVQVDNKESLKELFQGDSVVPDSLEQFVTTSRAATLKLDKRRDGTNWRREWRCSQGHQHSLDDSEIYTAYRAKQELIFPLWDQLWMELSTDRAGLHERKDKEQRDNMQAEHRETVQAIDGFNAERRDIRSRIDSLNSSTIRAVETFGELISSFVQSALVSDGEVAGELREAQQFRSEYTRLLGEIDRKIASIEHDLGARREESLRRHGPVMEFVDTVKVGTQFMPPPSPRGEVTVEKSREVSSE